MSGEASARASLRRGVSTGTAASGAAKAATLLLCGVDTASIRAGVEVTLPVAWTGRTDAPRSLILAIADVRREDAATASACVVKDAGDDPDVTHGASVCARVVLFREGPALAAHLARQRVAGRVCVQAAAPPPIAELPESVHIYCMGGAGVGVASLPGLPVAVGEPAINPEPRRQIHVAVAQALAFCCGKGASPPNGVVVELSIPGGDVLAQRTMNPALGVVGGLSILGTRGTVEPYSHAAFIATVLQGLDVARATDCETVTLVTGGRTARMARQAWPELPAHAIVQAGDAFAEATAQAVGRGFAVVRWAVLPGKLVKMAQGMPNTHARHGRVDLPRLVALAREHGLRGMDDEHTRLAGKSVTARGVFEAIRQASSGEAILRELVTTLARRAARHTAEFAAEAAPAGATPPRVAVMVFDEDGTLLGGVEHGT